MRLGNIKKLLWELVTIPDHMVFWIPFAIAKGIQILWKEKCELIYTTSPPHSEQIIGFTLSKIFKKPWVADFRDPMLEGSDYAPASKMRFWIDQLLEKLIVKNADKVIIISDHYRETICKRYHTLEDKFIVLPNGFDPEPYEKSPSETFDKFTILYSGSFYPSRNPRFFLRGFSKWLAKQSAETKDRVQVHFYGPESDEAKRIVREEGLESLVHFPGIIPQDSLIPKQKGAHLLLLIIGFDSESRGTVTSKIFEYIACNRPILAIIPEGDASAVLKDYDRVHFVNREDDELLINSLNLAYKDYLKNNHYLNLLCKYTYSDKTNAYNAQTQTRDLANIFLETESR
jgi:glycosyltransferase involved in cell wall biosynthesis